MIQGVFTALITPFNKDGSVDIGAYRDLVKRQIDGGVDGLVPVGTTGESPTLESSEKEMLIEEAVKIAAGKIPVIAGTGSNNTKAAVEATKKASALGADITLQVAPYYNKPAPEGLYRHFAEVAEKGDLPVMIYNVPGRSGINISPWLLNKLALHPKIIAVKEANGDPRQFQEFLSRRPDNFSVLSGDDVMTLPMMVCGAQGVVSVASNMFPKEMVELVRHMAEGRLKEALALHNRLYPFFINQFIETNPVPIKTYMAQRGLCQEVFRLPLSELSSENRKILLSTSV